MSNQNNNATVKVDANVPLPTRSNRGRPRGDYSKTLISLKVGESFLYPVRKNPRSSRSTVYIWKRRFAPDRKFQTAEQVVDDVKYIRVWRVA